MAEDKRKMTPEQKQFYRSKLLLIMTSRIGKDNIIGMGELYQQVFGEPWQHRINDTRALRDLITELRKEGCPICSSASASGGGYWLGQKGKDTGNYLRNLREQGLRKLALEASIRKVSLAELLGQARLELMGSRV